MIIITDKKDCCGCSACMNICPKHCITMKSDDEGFLYPEIYDRECINCDMCEKVCPVVKAKDFTPYNEYKQGFMFQSNNEQELKESTSGGFFSTLARYVLSKNGVVFGAAFDQDLHIGHKYIENVDDLHIFRNSKYIQSEIGDSYRCCQDFLKDGRLVCFSGTPCQIAGLKSFLRKHYDNLITVDVICRGVPSPGLFEKYLKYLGGIDNISKVMFRDKFYGYYSSTFSILYKNGKSTRRDIRRDPMLNFFFQDLCSRPSCYHCSFKTIDRVSDFTMFDCWHAVKHSTLFDTRGVTGVIARNEHAEELMHVVCIGNKSESASVEQLVNDDGFMMTTCVKENQKRQEFFNDIKNMKFGVLARKYTKKSESKNLKDILKTVLIKTGIFDKIMYRRMIK